MKYVSFLPIIAIAVGFWFFLIRPQKKQEKEIQKMRNSLEVGDQITTIGGITGIVRQIKDEDTYIIETGADKSKIAIKKWAVQSKDTVSDK
jgi:preprotein translocase subunit YajC